MTALDRHPAIGAAIAVAAGTCIWMAFAAGPRHADVSPRFEFFAPALATAAVLLALNSDLSHGRIAAALVGPGILLAWWTVPRGDEDGLWILIFPVLVVGAVFLAAGVVLARALAQWVRTRR